MALSIELIDTTRPATLRFHLFHMTKRFLNSEIKSFHIDIFLGLSPTLTPRDLNGKLPTLHERKIDTASKNKSRTLIPKSLLLWKLIPNPDINSKPLRMVFILHKFAVSPSARMIVSSANWSIS